MFIADYTNPAPGIHRVEGDAGVIELTLSRVSGGTPLLVIHASFDVHQQGPGAQTPCIFLRRGECWREMAPISSSYLQAYYDDDEPKLKPWLLEEYAGLASQVLNAQKARA
jgi:hypothetical protein